MRLQLILAAGLSLLVAKDVYADTIVLKNGRRIVADSVVVEGDKVRYFTAAGELALPKSMVDHIEKSGATQMASTGAANLAITPPSLEPNKANAAAESGAVHDGLVDREFLAEVASEARSGGAGANEKASIAYHAAAQLELVRGDMEHALDYLERAQRVAPDNPDVPKLTGWAYYGMNKLSQAVSEWERALALRPDVQVQAALDKAKRDQQEEENYRENESSHFTLRYSGEAEPGLAREVLRALEIHFSAIESELGYTPPEPIGVILYTQQAFADITRAPGWAGALNDGRIRVPVQGLKQLTPELSRVLKHELTHSFIQQKTRANAPTWVQEGLAQWMEGKRSGATAGVLLQVYDAKQRMSLGDLEGSWLQLSSGAAAYAYAWALANVEYIVQVDGMTDMERILDRLAGGGTVESALHQVLRSDYEELMQSTAQYLRKTY